MKGYLFAHEAEAAFGDLDAMGHVNNVIKRSSLVFEYAVRSKSDERIVAEAKTVVVCYDYERMRSKAVLPELSTAILALDKEARIEI